jgi:hypothetical protein
MSGTTIKVASKNKFMARVNAKREFTRRRPDEFFQKLRLASLHESGGHNFGFSEDVRGVNCGNC